MNVGGIAHISHDLKTTAATLGLMRLSHLCRDIESAADGDRIEDAIGLAEELPLMMEQAMQALTALSLSETSEI